jgi:putative transposase
VWTHLSYVNELEINKKLMHRLLRKHGLLVRPDMKLKANRTSSRSKPKPVRPNQWWGIDMSKVMVNGFGWMYIVVVLNWYSKKIVGYYSRYAMWKEGVTESTGYRHKQAVCG